MFYFAILERGRVIVMLISRVELLKKIHPSSTYAKECTEEDIKVIKSNIEVINKGLKLDEVALDNFVGIVKLAGSDTTIISPREF